MQNSNRPTRFTLPFAQNDSSRVEIPVTTTDATRASLSLGFPPLTMTPPEAGGVPPQGEDFNGAMNQIARAVRWVVAGTFWPYDATFSTDTNVGGYPQGSIVQNSTFTGWLGSRVENNTTNPTAGQSGNWGPLTNAGYELTMATGTAASISLTDEQAAAGYMRLTGTVFRNTSFVLPSTTGLHFSFIHDAANDVTAPNAVISVVDAFSNSVTVYPGQRVTFRTRNDGRLVAVSTGAAPNQFSSLQTVSGATTLPTTYAGALVLLTGASNYTVTLPLASTFAPGAPIDFLAVNTGTVTISRQGSSDTITANGSVSGLTTLSMVSGDKLTLVSDGTKWYVQAGTVGLQYATSQQGFKTISGNTTLDASYARLTTTLTGASGSFYVVTLPAASAVQPGTPINLFSIAASQQTVQRGGADVIVVNNAGQAQTSMLLQSGDTAQLMSDGVSKWYLTDGSAQTYYARTMSAFPAVVGGVRNLRATLAAAATSLTITADEVIVEDQLGGRPYSVPTLNSTLNVATTGAGGMDTGAAPTNGYVGIYLIFNPNGNVRALLGVNATSAAVPQVYGGANMPIGYTHSALVGVWPTNGSGQFVVGYLTDRKMWLPPAAALSTTTTSSTPVQVSIATTVPFNARSVGGILGLSCSAVAAMTSSVAADSSGTGQQNNLTQSASTAQQCNFEVPIITAQNIWYTATTTAGTLTMAVNRSFYTF